MNVQFSTRHVGNVIVFQVQDAFSVLNNGGGIRRDKELHWLNFTILS
jgi:hypothetical protein